MKLENIFLPVLMLAATTLLIKSLWPKGLTVEKQRQSLINRFSEFESVFKKMSNPEIVFSYGWIAIKEHKNKNVINAFLSRDNNRNTLTSIQEKYKIFT